MQTFPAPRAVFESGSFANFAERNATMVLAIAFVFLTSAVHAQSAIEFNRDIRTILSDNCFACHGPDKNARQGDLRLDERQSALESGAIVPGSSAKSSTLERVLSEDPELVMPPPKTGKKLTPKQIETLKQWIDSGAEYQSHWAYIPVPKAIPVPKNSIRNKAGQAWAVNEIDQFVAERLERQGIAPSLSSDKMRWLRRVSFDLTGLPPSLADIDAFLADNSDASYSTVVDRLLASNAYGERMASMWLDVARYADTFGYQFDAEMNVWPWRDWVIRTFNRNLPYDQFIVEQIAGDMLPNATQDQRLATTFNRLHRQTNEGGSIEEEFRQLYIADRTVTAGTAFLGLTLECSRCHDHKYDPVTQKDFYQLANYFSNIDEHGLYSHFTTTAPTPTLLLYSGDQEQRHHDLVTQSETAAVETKKVLESSHASFVAGDAAKAGQDAEWPTPKPDQRFPLDGAEPGVVGNATRCNGDDAIDCPGVPAFTRTEPLSLSIWVQPSEIAPRVMLVHQSVAAEDSAFRGLQLVLENGRPQFSLIHFWPGNAIRVESKEAIPLNEWSLIGVTYDGSSRADGVRLFVNGIQVPTTTERDQLTRDFQYRAAWGDSNGGKSGLSIGARFRDIGFRNSLVDDLQVFQRELSTMEVGAIYLDASSGKREVFTKAGLPNIAMKWDHYRLHDDKTCTDAVAKLRELRKQEDELVSQIPQIMTMRVATNPRKTFILGRGAYDAPQAEVKAGLPTVIAANSQKWAEVPVEKRDRLHLAKWLTSTENPLTARVTVNRFWHLFYGRGLVASLEDFGSQGIPPTHPELLDWLARDFMDNGWDVKRLCKQIVLSATYRQNSQPENPELLSLDPENRWLARGPRHRLSAEQVRDAALSVSGLLSPTIGGPSVKPYQPAGLWEEAGTGKSYSQSTGDGLYRRSLYTFWRRTAPPPSMLTFDATSRETCTAKRELTTTPLQALVLQNDPQYIEASRVLADQLLQTPDLNQRWQKAFQMLLTRQPSEKEAAIVQHAFETQREYFQSDKEAAKALVSVGERPRDVSHDEVELATTTLIVNMIMCYDEFFMKR